MALGAEDVLRECGGVGLVHHPEVKLAHAGCAQRSSEELGHRHVAPAEVGREAQEPVPEVDHPGHAQPHPEHAPPPGPERRHRARHEPRHVFRRTLWLPVVVGGEPRGEHPAGEVAPHHVEVVGAELDPDERQMGGVERERHRAPPRAATRRGVELGHPAFVDELLHQRADGGLGEAAPRGKVGAGEPWLGLEQADQGHPVDALQQALVARGRRTGHREVRRTG